VGIAYKFFRGNERKAFALKVEAEVNVGGVEPVPAVDNNSCYVFKRFYRAFAKAKIVFARFFEEILADNDFVAFGKDLCRVSVHIKLTRSERENAAAELDISALTALIKHHAVSIV
jgi:hypothetical protein